VATHLAPGIYTAAAAVVVVVVVDWRYHLQRK
jgi:hypothetical protein